LATGVGEHLRLPGVDPAKLSPVHPFLVHDEAGGEFGFAHQPPPHVMCELVAIVLVRLLHRFGYPEEVRGMGDQDREVQVGHHPEDLMSLGGVLDQDAVLCPVQERGHLGVTGTVAVEILEASVEIIACGVIVQVLFVQGDGVSRRLGRMDVHSYRNHVLCLLFEDHTNASQTSGKLIRFEVSERTGPFVVFVW